MEKVTDNKTFNALKEKFGDRIIDAGIDKGAAVAII
mgnify:CR=1 FL=1